MQFLLHNGLDSIVHQKIFITYLPLRPMVFAEDRSAMKTIFYFYTKKKSREISILCIPSP